MSKNVDKIQSLVYNDEIFDRLTLGQPTDIGDGMYLMKDSLCRWGFICYEDSKAVSVNMYNRGMMHRLYLTDHFVNRYFERIKKPSLPSLASIVFKFLNATTIIDDKVYIDYWTIVFKEATNHTILVTMYLNKERRQKHNRHNVSIENSKS